MSKINPIFVYNQHQSPVSALAFGRHSQQPVLVSGSDDGELHVWRLTDFASLIKIQVHQSKVLGLECLNGGSIEQNRSEKMNEKLTEMVNEQMNQEMSEKMNEKLNENLPDDLSEEQSTKSRPVNCGLRFVSQEKNGLIKFVCLFSAANEATNEVIIRWRVYNELSCSASTFCPFQVLTIGSRLLLACIPPGSSNCVNLVVMNEVSANDDRSAGCNAGDNADRNDAPDGNQDNCGVFMNEQIVQIDQTLGMISSMRMKAYGDLILLLIGTETGSCLIYTGDEQRAISEKAAGQFTLKYQQQCFGESFVSSLELDDGRLFSGQHLRLICGSVEDCLAVVDLMVEFASRKPCESADLQALSKDPQQGPSDELQNQLENNLQNILQSKLQNKLKISKPQVSFSNKETAKPVKYLKITNKGINSIACRPDSKLFASGGSDGRVRLFSLKSLNALAVLAFHKQTIEMIKFSGYLTEHKGHLLAAAGQDKLVTVWSVYPS